MSMKFSANEAWLLLWQQWDVCVNVLALCAWDAENKIKLKNQFLKALKAGLDMESNNTATVDKSMLLSEEEDSLSVQSDMMDADCLHEQDYSCQSDWKCQIQWLKACTDQWHTLPKRYQWINVSNALHINHLRPLHWWYWVVKIKK